MPVQMRPATIDFSALTQMGSDLGGALAKRRLQNDLTGAMGPDGTFDYGKAVSILMKHDPKAALTLAAQRERANEPPASFREFQYGQQNPAYGQYLKDVKPSNQFRLEMQQEKQREKAEGAKNRRDVLTQELSRLKETALGLKQHPGLSRASGEFKLDLPVVGEVGTGYAASDVYTRPGSDPANFEAQFETLKSQIGFNVLQAMRQASQTGGALGQVAVQELIMLQNNLGALDPKQSPEALQQQLQKIADHADSVIERLGQAYEQEAGGSGGNAGSPFANSQGGQLAPGQVVNGFRYRGGNPNDQTSWEPMQ